MAFSYLLIRLFTYPPTTHLFTLFTHSLPRALSPLHRISLIYQLITVLYHSFTSKRTHPSFLLYSFILLCSTPIINHVPFLPTLFDSTYLTVFDRLFSISSPTHVSPPTHQLIVLFLLLAFCFLFHPLTHPYACFHRRSTVLTPTHLLDCSPT